MFDIKAMIKALRIMWVKRFLGPGSAPWKNILEWRLKSQGGTFFLHCNFDVNELNLPLFYKDMLSYWHDFKMSNIHDNDRIKCFIWNNKDVKIRGKTVFNKELMNRGIWYIHDIFNDSGWVLSQEDLAKQKITGNMLLQFYGVASAIPKIIKDLAKSEDTLHTVNDVTMVKLNQKEVKIMDLSTKEIHHFFVNNNGTISIAKEKLSLVLQIEPKNWKDIYQIPRFCCEDTKLIEFQYMFLHNAIYFNNILFKMRPPRVHSAYCTFCNFEIETRSHLFVECDNTKYFWNDFERWWSRNVGENLILNKRDIFVGDFMKISKFSELLNIAIILAKKHIYSRRCSNTKPSFNMFLVKLDEMKTIELSLNKNHIKRKWTPLLR